MNFSGVHLELVTLLLKLQSCFRFFRYFGLWALLLLFGACSGAKDAVPDSGIVAVDSGSVAPVRFCQEIEAELDDVEKKPRRVLGDLIIVFADAEPRRIDRGDNVFTFLLMNNDETPYEHKGDVLLSPFMPEHGHGSLPLDVPPQEVSSPALGKYIFGPIDLFMLGRWDLHLRLLNEDGTEKEAVFTVCIEG